jgi:hypothetical protein
MSVCEQCKKNNGSIVPKSWSTTTTLCLPCFVQNHPETKVLTFDVLRGGLLSRWTVEGFAPTALIVTKQGLHTLATLLDEHHLKLIREGDASNVVPASLLEDYRASGAIYCMDAKQFWTEMWGFYY